MSDEQRDEQPRARRDSLGESGARKQLYLAAIPVLVALAALITAVTGHVQSCSAKQQAGEAKGAVQDVAQEAVEAKAVAGAGYQATKEKLDPTSEEVVQLRKDVDAIKAELAAARARREQRAGRRAKPAPKPDPVAPEVSKPMPETPAAAAAAAPGGT